MNRASETDSRALENYCNYLRPLARRQLSPRLQGKLDAADVVQETILEAHKSRLQFRGSSECEWLAWLRVILAHVLAGAVRYFSAESHDLRRECSLEAEVDRLAARLECVLEDDQTSPSEQAVRGEDLLRLARALACLSDDQRQVVELRYLKGLSLAEVAARIGRTRPAVAGLLFRGLEKLRDLLQERSGVIHSGAYCE